MPQLVGYHYATNRRLLRVFAIRGADQYNEKIRFGSAACGNLLVDVPAVRIGRASSDTWENKGNADEQRTAGTGF